MPKRVEPGRSKTAVANRERLFVERYLVNGNNATDAAKAAGFGPKTARHEGYRLLQRPSVIALLGDRAEQVIVKAELSTERWAKEMAAIAFFDIGELYDKDGALIPINELPEHVRRAIASVDIETRTEGRGEDAELVRTTKIKTNDKNAALTNVGRHLGTFDEDNRQREGVRVLVQLVG